MSIDYYRPNSLPLKSVLPLLELCDQDFTPPLSSRGSTTQVDLTSHTSSYNNLVEYGKNLVSQKCLFIPDSGILSWISDFQSTCCPLPAHTDYVTTLMVAPILRGNGLAESFYQKLFEISPNPIAFRTWSSNTPHITLAKKLGFSLFHMIQDDRAPGVHTEYYVRFPR